MTQDTRTLINAVLYWLKFFSKKSNFKWIFSSFFSKFSRYVDFHKFFLDFSLILCKFYVYFALILPYKIACDRNSTLWCVHMFFTKPKVLLKMFCILIRSWTSIQKKFLETWERSLIESFSIHLGQSLIMRINVFITDDLFQVIERYLFLILPQKIYHCLKKC